MSVSDRAAIRRRHSSYFTQHLLWQMTLRCLHEISPGCMPAVLSAVGVAKAEALAKVGIQPLAGAFRASTK